MRPLAMTPGGIAAVPLMPLTALPTLLLACAS